MFPWCRGLVCAGQRAPSLNIEPCMYQLLLWSIAGSVHLNQGIGFGLCVFYRSLYFQFFGFTPSVHIDFYTLLCSCCWTVMVQCGINELLVTNSHCKALGCNWVLQSEAFCTKTGDFWSEHQVTPEFLAIKTSAVLFQGLTLCWTFPAHTRVKSRSGSFTGKGFKD